MNKKAQAGIIGIMMGIILFMTIIVLVTPIKDEVIAVRNASNLDCENTSISVGESATCILVDFAPFYWFGIGLGVAVAWASGRMIKDKIGQ